MVIRNSVRYLMNRLMFGSECIYHEENCIIDHVTKRATDVNRIEKKSVLKLILSSIEFMVTQCQVVIIYSILLWKNINRGKRLIMKENLIDVVVYSGKLMCLIRFDIEIRIGDSRRTSQGALLIRASSVRDGTSVRDDTGTWGKRKLKEALLQFCL